MQDYCTHRFRCHGNRPLNDGSKSLRSIPTALCMILNLITYVAGRERGVINPIKYVAGRARGFINPIKYIAGRARGFINPI